MQYTIYNDGFYDRDVTVAHFSAAMDSRFLISERRLAGVCLQCLRNMELTLRVYKCKSMKDEALVSSRIVSVVAVGSFGTRCQL